MTPDELKRLIALLIYFGLVKVSHVDKYWSKKTLYHGLWAREPDFEHLWPFYMLSILQLRPQVTNYTK